MPLKNKNAILESMKPTRPHEEENEIRLLYYKLIEAWNKREAPGMASLFTEDGNIVGFDGTYVESQTEIGRHLATIFFNHPTAAFVTKIKGIRFVTPEVAHLHSIVSMIPPGENDLKSEVNAIQTLIAVKENQNWKIAQFQNTPAAFHGRPHLVEQMTEELREELNENSRAQEGAQGF